MIVTLTGSNSFGVQQALNGLVATYLAENDAIGLERLDGEDTTFERLREALTSLPFLSSKKLVIVRCPGVNKEFASQIETVVADVPDTTDVVIVEPKLDKRSAYYKFLKKATDYREFAELDANSLSRWIGEYVHSKGGGIRPADARFLVERVGINQQLLLNEVDKLFTYNNTISRDSIMTLTDPTPQSSIFDLLEAAFNGNLQRTMSLYDEQRSMKVEPQQIIAMLAWQLQVIALAKTAGTKTPDQIAKEARISPFVVKKTVAMARKITLSQFKRQLQTLKDIDVRLKREGLDADEALRTYLLQLAQ